ncbi:protein PLASTID MOVEMENT IMPAIRED 2-like [Nicotiana tomentosiformis]|uniref:protein PLASTID MOVEMENT IMPAIRED 2-like n=1 Tax=Nicotiana tomentosiformis TaxID=4098 RepID=UPI00388C36E2
MMNEVDALRLFNEAQHALNRHQSVHRSWMEVSQLEFELKEQVRQKDMYKALRKQRGESLKDLPIIQAELEKTQKEASLVKREHAVLLKKVRVFEINNERLSAVTNTATPQVQENIDLIDQLRATMNEVKASTEALRRKMDFLASEKEATKEDLASAKDQLRVMKDKADKWSRLNDELRAQLYSAVSERDAPGLE